MVELHHESETVSSGAVQIGDPITQKKMFDFLLEARDHCEEHGASFDTDGLPERITRLLALARAQPGALSYGSGGTGSSTHLAMEYFRRGARDRRYDPAPVRRERPVGGDVLHADRLRPKFYEFLR